MYWLLALVTAWEINGSKFKPLWNTETCEYSSEKNLNHTVDVNSIRSPLHHHPQEGFLYKSRQHIKHCSPSGSTTLWIRDNRRQKCLLTISNIYAGTCGSSFLHRGDHIGLLRYITQANITWRRWMHSLQTLWWLWNAVTCLSISNVQLCIILT